MKEKIEKLGKFLKTTFKIIMGIDDNRNLSFYASFSFLITGVIFFVLAVGSLQQDIKSSNIFTYISSICFSIWLIGVQGSNSASKFVMELIRLISFFFILLFSLDICLEFYINHSSKSIVWVIFSSFGLFICVFYIISKLTTIFNLIKKLFKKIKNKIFDSNRTSDNKVKALIENITAFLVAVGGLTVAMKVIAESLFQVFEYLK